MDVKEDNSTIVGKHVFGANIGPTTQNLPLVRSLSSNVGPTTVLQLLKL